MHSFGSIYTALIKTFWQRIVKHSIKIVLVLKGNSRVDNIFQKNLANVVLIVIPSRNISSANYVAQKSRFKVLNLPLTRTSAINASILPIT